MSKRECGSCTACCEGWLPANINGAELKPGVGCKDLCKTGCGIYPDRPVQPCQVFKCGWLQEGSPLPENMRPDLCGAIVLLDRNWRGWNTIRALPLGEQVPAETMGWLKNHARKTATPLIFCQNKRQGDGYKRLPHQGYGPPAFVNEVRYAPGEEDIFRPAPKPPL